MASCTEPGCPKPYRARGLCSTHYNQQHQPDRHRTVLVACTQCGTQCEKEPTRAKRYGGMFCSLACRDAWRVATGTNPCPSPEAQRLGRETRHGLRWRVKLELRRTQRRVHGEGVWVAGDCARCGHPFVSQMRRYPGRFCSDACKSAIGRATRRARERGADREPYSRRRIFERDRWRCHICKRMTLRTRVVPHPRAPTLDHLTPLADGGADTAANVATACFVCNSTKGRHGGGEQLMLIG